MNPTKAENKRPFCALMILDGFGCREESEGNAIRIGGTPNIDSLLAQFPNTRIGASGLSVGLPDGQMGNSEVGHLNIGAGRIVYQELTRISKDIAEGGIYSRPEFVAAMPKGGRLHLLGLLSDGGVHSHLDHLLALVRMAKRQEVKEVLIHCFMDGRDVPPKSGAGYIDQLEAALKEIGIGKIATVSGRYYAMDRDNRWERVQRAYDALAKGEGLPVSSAAQAMADSYAKDETDEFVQPSVVMENGAPVGKIQAGDCVICFNFRPDRAREITRVFTQDNFDGFVREKFPLHWVCMTQYDKTFEGVEVAYKPQTLKNTLGEYLSSQGLTQFRIAETEKYAHVTFFFNGGVEQANPGEERVLIPSPKVATYDLQPEMSAREVAAKAEELIESRKYDVMILNFANADMVGHTGVLDAACAAIRAVDECVGQVVRAIRKVGGRVLITADHGNAEQMFDEVVGGPFTAHTTNRVPVILVSEDHKTAKLREDGILADLAPTLLELLGLEQPAEMEGRSLIVK